MAQPVVITGVGVVSPLGVGHELFWEGLAAGRVGVRRIDGLDALPEAFRWAGQVHDFQPEEILGSKGLKYLNQATRFLLSAAELARRDANLEITPERAEEIGVIVGSSVSNVGDCVAFYESLLAPGERTNPLRFPNLFINIAGGNLAIRLGVRGLNTTLTNGATSALDALQHGLTALHCRRARTLLVGGVEVLSPPLVEACWRAGLLADTMAPRPFDRRRRGLVLGEGCGVVVLELAEEARARGARVYGEVAGYGSASVEAGDATQAMAASVAGAIREALRMAGVGADEVDYVAAGAGSAPAGDHAEAMALRQLFAAD